MTYHSVYDEAEDGTIWGYTPEFPGAYGAGDTLDEAKASLREAICLWLETAPDGTVIPNVRDSIELVELQSMPA